MQLRTPPRAPRRAPPFSRWRAQRQLRRSTPRPRGLGFTSRTLSRRKLHREFRKAAREAREPLGSRLSGALRAPFRGWISRPRGPLFRGKLDRNLALIAIAVLGGGVAALVFLTGGHASTSAHPFGQIPATPQAVATVATTPTVQHSPTKHATSKPAPTHPKTTKAHTTQPAPPPTTPAVLPPPQTNPPNPSPKPSPQPSATTPSPSPSPTSTTPSPSPSPSPTPTPVPSLTTPPIP